MLYNKINNNLVGKMGPMCKFACFLCKKSRPFDFGPPAELLTVKDLKYWLKRYHEHGCPKADAQDFFNIIEPC